MGTAAGVTERCYGIDVAEDGVLVLAEGFGDGPAGATRFSTDEAGIAAMRRYIGRDATRLRVCVRSFGAAAVGVALGLATLPAEVTIVAPRAIETLQRPGRETAVLTPEESAQRLAKLAERMY